MNVKRRYKMIYESPVDGLEQIVTLEPLDEPAEKCGDGKGYVKDGEKYTFKPTLSPAEQGLIEVYNNFGNTDCPTYFEVYDAIAAFAKEKGEMSNK